MHHSCFMQFVARSGIAARTQRPECGIPMPMTETTKIILFSIAMILIVLAALLLTNIQPLLAVWISGCGPVWVAPWRRRLGNDACGQGLAPRPTLVIVWRP